MATPQEFEEFALTKTLLAWAERAAAQGLDVAADLQPSTDDPAQMRRLVHHIKAGAPELRAAPIAFEEPESHRKAREILGPDFHSVEAAQRHFMPYSMEELAARMAIPFAEEILRPCAGEFVLLPTHPLDLPAIHAAHPERFTADPDNPWFGGRQRKAWSQKITVPWLLIRKKVVPDSWSKVVIAQQEHLKQAFPNERFQLPAEYCYAAILHYLETRERLGGDYHVRFAVQSPGGSWVTVLWDGGRLHIDDWYDYADDSVASASAWAS